MQAKEESTQPGDGFKAVVSAAATGRVESQINESKHTTASSDGKGES